MHRSQLIPASPSGLVLFFTNRTLPSSDHQLLEYAARELDDTTWRAEYANRDRTSSQKAKDRRRASELRSNETLRAGSWVVSSVASIDTRLYDLFWANLTFVHLSHTFRQNCHGTQDDIDNSYATYILFPLIVGGAHHISRGFLCSVCWWLVDGLSDCLRPTPIVKLDSGLTEANWRVNHSTVRPGKQ